MNPKSMLVLAGLVLVLACTLSASPLLPGQGWNGQMFSSQPSSCTGDFGGGTGVCNIFEEPSNPEQQDFNLGSPNIGTGLVDIYDSNGITLSDSLLFYTAADGNVHLLFSSDGFAQPGGFFGATEDANGNWCYLCGFGNNVYMGVSPPENGGVPEPASLFMLGSGLFGLGGFVRRRMNKA